MNKAVLVNANIVVLASSFNPSIISKDWMTSNGLVEEPISNFVHTPVFSLVENKDFQLAVDQDRLQLSAKKPVLRNMNLMAVTIKKFFSTLPETPYSSMGFNFAYRIPVKIHFLEKIVSQKEQTIKELFSANYGLGVIVLFKFRSFVVRVNVSPPIPGNEFQTVNFNFHSSIRNGKEGKRKSDLYRATLERAERILKNE